MNKYQKVLVLGSGALKIGEAGEFDYSGSQAMKALREAGIKTVLINPNIATIQTSPLLADEIYFLPVTPEFVERVIAKERPDGILLAFGGQTALNCGVELHRRGILKKFKVKVLGTPVPAIVLTEDRDKFAKHLRKIGVPVPPSGATASLLEAKHIARRVGYPAMVRAAYSLGGQKSGVAYTEEDLVRIVEGALATSPQVLIEKYLHHFKEIEYEVVRDSAGNCVTVCNMENMDPMGIHTGESIVVAPSQTLNNSEYHKLREVSIKIVKSLGIVGECNVQFALNPHPSLNPFPSRGGKQKRNIPPPRGGSVGGGDGKIDYYVIEVNARLSRSSALASKATGYPLAYVAAKLALGQLLREVPNQVTKVTQSFFEPALDYCVVKIPRWDLEKFKGAEERIGSAMKSVGEVMAVGRTFEEALQKAVRMLHIGLDGVTDNGFGEDRAVIKRFLEVATPKRLFAIATALKHNFSISQISKLTGIDPWFLHRIKNIVKTEKIIAVKYENFEVGAGIARPIKGKPMASPTTINHDDLLNLKRQGFSDKRIGSIVGRSEMSIRALRKKLGILPAVFQIDTLAGEAPAPTNYLYLTYNGSHHDVAPISKRAVIVLGSGPYHIGSSVEFDWSCVHTALALKKYLKQSIIINCNPETVSTDYDMSDRLYFEDLSFETVADICDFEQEEGVIISVGGQTPNNLAQQLAAYKVRILGTKAADIDRAEDRNKFSDLLDKLGILQPAWSSFASMADMQSFAVKVGYPVLVRPSYVLSGSAMSVCFNDQELETFIRKATLVNAAHPVTVSKFIPGAKEIELDAVAQKGTIQVFAIAEHVENAGVHSGDATIVYPTQKVYVATQEQIIRIARQLAIELNISGPFNIQFLVKEGRVHVIEINLRASRSFPFISKATGVNFAEVAVAAFYGKSQPVVLPFPGYAVVKSPQFSFSRLLGADPVLRVEMASTGEVACFGDTFEEALLKSVLSSVTYREKKAVLLSIGGIVNKKRFLDSAKKLVEIGFTLFATDTTTDFLMANNVPAKKVAKAYEGKGANVLDIINQKKVEFVINISDRDTQKERHFEKHVTDGYRIRRAAVDSNIPLLTDLQLARSFVRAFTTYKLDDLKIKSWREYST